MNTGNPFHERSRADLVWGPSRSGKGQNAWTAAYWMAQTYGKRTLYLTAEPGAILGTFHQAEKSGMVDIMSLVGQRHLMSILYTILEGGKWAPKTSEGVRDFNSREAECDPDRNGLLIIDALGSIGDLGLLWFTDPENGAVLPMSPGEDKFSVKDFEMGGKIVNKRGSSPTHVGEICRILQELVMHSANLPYQKVLWIAREQRAAKGQKTDKQGNVIIAGEPIYGPDLPGQAATQRVCSWFGAAYHTAKVPVEGGFVDERKDVGGHAGAMYMGDEQKRKLTEVPKEEYRLYLRPHPDHVTGIMYDAGNRLPAYVNDGQFADKPFVVCTEKVEQTEKDIKFIHTGLNTIYEMERTMAQDTATKLGNSFKSWLDKHNSEKK